MSAGRTFRWAIAAALIVAASSFVAAGVVAAHARDSGSSSTGPTYSVTFSETGLAAGTNWSVTAFQVNSTAWGNFVHGSSNTSSIVLQLSNGSYGYHVHGVRGYEILSGGRGTFNVSGASPPTIDVTFGVPAVYTVTFTEHGLPANTTWSVHIHPLVRIARGVGSRLFQSTNNTTLTFSLPNGSYAYAAHAHGFHATSGGWGFFNVSGASPAGITVNFSTVSAPTLYTVTFTETGLPAGTNWTAIVAGGSSHASPWSYRHAAETTSNASQNFSLANGSYRYDILPVSGYAIADNASHGSFNVSGAPLSIAITFVKQSLYAVTFTETGLPSGANWSVAAVSAGGYGWSVSFYGTSNTTSLTLSLPNGSYYYFAIGSDGYVASTNGSGAFNVTGASPATIAIGFTLPNWGGGWGGWNAPAQSAARSA